MEHVVKSSKAEGLKQEITPASAGWKFLEFTLHSVAAGESVRDSSRDQEVAVVFLSGSAAVSAGGVSESFKGREHVLRGLPHALYVPPGVDWEVRAETELEFAIAKAPADGRYPARFITPGDVTVEIRGGHNVTRQISHLIDPGQAEKLLCVEVLTPSGNWSSYPPHMHDVQALPDEVDLEEVYHYRFLPGDGWAVQRLYNDDRSLNELLLVGEEDTVLVRQGYHPVVTAPGYDAYYLNFLAGETPSWIARDEPQLAWVRDSWEGRADRLRIPLTE